MSPDATPRPDKAVIAVATIALVTVGFVAGAAVTSGPTQRVSADEPAWVGCSAFIDEDGSAAAICFTRGDVQLEWLGNRMAENGTMSLSGLPKNNSTVRRGS